MRSPNSARPWEPPYSDASAAELFQQNFIASAPPQVASEFHGTVCFLSKALPVLAAHPSLLGELRVLSLHGGWWQEGSKLLAPHVDLIRLGRAATALEELTLSQSRLPAGLRPSIFMHDDATEDDLAPPCLLGSYADVLAALQESGSGDAAPASPFPRLTHFVLDSQNCPGEYPPSGGLCPLLRRMPALTLFAMVFNDEVKYLGDEYGGSDDSAPIADALRDPGCGGGVLNTFRSHDVILGFADDPPLGKRDISFWDHVDPEHYIDCGELPPRLYCSYELRQIEADDGLVGAPERGFEMYSCSLCDEVNSFYFEYGEEAAVWKAWREAHGPPRAGYANRGQPEDSSSGGSLAGGDSSDSGSGDSDPAGSDD